MSRSLSLIVLLSSLGISAANPMSAQATPRIEVGPNIRVSNDGNIPHIEPMFAVHPANPKLLVAVVTTQRETELVTAAYASRDGGFTWGASALPLHSSLDPQVAIGKTGTAYFPALGNGPAGRG